MEPRPPHPPPRAPRAPRARLRGSAAIAVVGAVALSCLVVGAGSGCTKDPAQAVLSRRGEACRASSDCEEGLACAPTAGILGGGTCVTANFHITPTGKQCVIVECGTAGDCCDPSLDAACQQLANQCYTDASPGACETFAIECGCLAGTIECLSGKCTSHCNVDTDCTSRGTGKRCSGGVCAACIGDNDCGGGQTCVSGACQAACTSDGDCSGFDRCLNRRCIPSGCQTDRECVAATRNVDARCGTDGKCIIPCQTDLECGSPTSYGFLSCIDNRCVDVGCDSDKDCSLLLDGGASSKEHAQCKDKGVGVVVP